MYLRKSSTGGLRYVGRYTRTVGHFESCRYPSVKSRVGFDDAGVAPD